MQKVTIATFHVVGITVRTTNENGQAATDIPQLWTKFMSEGISQQIPNKLDERIFALYTNYEGDHTHAYDTILGCKVSSLDNIPEGMVGQTFVGGTYSKFLCKGDLTKGAVYNTWTEIWNKNLDRTYTADFELYDDRSQNINDAELDIFVAIK